MPKQWACHGGIVRKANVWPKPTELDRSGAKCARICLLSNIVQFRTGHKAHNIHNSTRQKWPMATRLGIAGVHGAVAWNMSRVWGTALSAAGVDKHIIGEPVCCAVRSRPPARL